MSISITRGNKSAFFRAINAPYVFLFVEGARQARIFTMEQLANWLKKAIASNHVTSDEAETITRQVHDCGVLENLTQVFEAIAKATFEGDFIPSYQFMVCHDCPMPTPHGRIVEIKDGANSSLPLATLKDALDYVFKLLEDGGYDVRDCLHVLQRMVVEGLPLDDDAAQKMYEALPPDKLAELDATAPKRMMSIDVPGLGQITLIEIVMPSSKPAPQSAPSPV